MYCGYCGTKATTKNQKHCKECGEELTATNYDRHLDNDDERLFSDKKPLRGWLLFLCIGLWLTPLSAASVGYGAFTTYNGDSPGTKILIGALVAYVISAIIAIILVAGRKPQSRAAIAAWLVLGVVVSTAYAALGGATLTIAVIAGNVWALVWFMYLHMSVRVEKTFGLNNDHGDDTVLGYGMLYLLLLLGIALLAPNIHPATVKTETQPAPASNQTTPPASGQATDQPVPIVPQPDPNQQLQEDCLDEVATRVNSALAQGGDIESQRFILQYGQQEQQNCYLQYPTGQSH